MAVPPSIVLTGFEPFAGSSINPSAAVVQRLGAAFSPAVSLHTMILPVDRVAGPARLVAALHALRPDWCVMLGEAAGRAAVSIERVALNLADFRIPDNGGRQPRDEPIEPHGPAAYFVSLPVRLLEQAVAAAGVPVELSLSAGSFVCNELLYHALHACASAKLATRCGFIHLPALPEQLLADRPAVPTMPLDGMAAGVRAALDALVRHPESL